MYFLKSVDYQKTKNLAEECFGCSASTDEYYNKKVKNNKIAVIEENGELVSMFHLKRLIATFSNGEKMLVWYILYVCTKIDKRNKGYMRKIANELGEILKKQGEYFTFCVPKNKNIWSKLDFNIHWKFNENEREFLEADDDLIECSAKLLNGKELNVPIYLKEVMTVDKCEYKFLGNVFEKQVVEYFYKRPNMTNSSFFIETFFWKDVLKTKYIIIDDRCMLLLNNNNGSYDASLPYCDNKDLIYYFEFEEKYFNDILKQPLCIYGADSEGIKILNDAGMLDNYEVIKENVNFNYIYDVEALRTFEGSEYIKKRNRYSHFVRENEGNYKYKKFEYGDRNDILSFIDVWENGENDKIEKNAHTYEDKYKDKYEDKNFTTKDSLNIEYDGIKKILQNEKMFNEVKFAGIYVGGVLKAIAMGAYNPLMKMVDLSVLKADSKISGLYQAMLKEFLLNEWKDAVYVNMEDDIEIEEIRKMKMEYNSIKIAEKYVIKQNII